MRGKINDISELGLFSGPSWGIGAYESQARNVREHETKKSM